VRLIFGGMKKILKSGLCRPVRFIEGMRSSADKVFCIGRNKTGTTSLNTALNNMGYRMAPQGPAELLIEEWSRRDFKKLASYCRYYDAFQDTPFSCPYTFIALDQVYKNAKFVLTIRGSADEWYQSLTKAHSKLFGGGDLPNSRQLKEAEYRYKGYMWDVHRLLYGVIEDQEYDKAIYSDHYNRHNEMVINYFRWRPEKLLIINVSDFNAYKNLAMFLGKKVADDADFPWKNKT